MNPEFRQRLQHISRNLESANEAAQENIYTFTQLYIDPCLTGLKSCLYDCTAPCFPNREDQLRRRRGRSQGRAQYDFDFYDDWDEEELGSSANLAWGNDELDSLLAGRGASQPRRQRAMSYGARRRRDEADSDPNIIPKSSYLGFLERLPFKFGSTGTKYRPSAANLEDNPGRLRVRDVEAAEPLISGEDDSGNTFQRGHSRQRSDTGVSHSTTTSHSSRGDLIMSDEEEDAVPLDDEFAAAILSRRVTGLSTYDELGNGTGRRSGGNSRMPSRTVSSRSIKGQNSRRSSGKKVRQSTGTSPDINRGLGQDYEPPTMLDLKQEEEQLKLHEELEIIQKREAALKLAQTRGLDNEDKSGTQTKNEIRQTSPLKTAEDQIPSQGYFDLGSPISSHGETEPFPGIDTPSKSPKSERSVRHKTSDEPP